MKVFINPGHDAKYDSGACNQDSGMREADVALTIGSLTGRYLEAAGCDVMMLQSDNLCNDSAYADRQGESVCGNANGWTADVFVSIHCNAAGGDAQGTETLVCCDGGKAGKLARCIQSQIVDSLGTVDRGVKERPNLIVLKETDMPAVLVETAFIDNDYDAELLANNQDDFARAIARGITDYEQAAS
jgi:N-acetylmuramoyl-L-alanine amidase